MIAYTPEQREWAISSIIDGLRIGTPLTVLCSKEGMPGVSTVYEWMDKDADVSGAIARAREIGFDAIAADCLAIADETGLDTIVTETGKRPDAEWISRSKLRVETRLKLLAKWDPKRYGDRTLHGSDPENPLPAGVSVSFK